MTRSPLDALFGIPSALSLNTNLNEKLSGCVRAHESAAALIGLGTSTDDIPILWALFENHHGQRELESTMKGQELTQLLEFPITLSSTSDKWISNLEARGEKRSLSHASEHHKKYSCSISTFS